MLEWTKTSQTSQWNGSRFPKPTECRMRNNFRDERGDGDRMIEVEGNVPSLSDKSVPVQPMKLSDSNRQYILLTW